MRAAWFVLILAASAWAQNASNWQALQQETGNDVRVKLKGGRSFEAKVTKFADDHLTLTEEGNNSFGVLRADVLAVEARRGPTARKRSERAGAVGRVVGVAAGAALGGYALANRGSTGAAVAVVATRPGAHIFEGIFKDVAHVVPTHYQVVYRAP